MCSNPGHQLRNGHFKGGSDKFQIAETNFLFAVFKVGNETAVYANVIGHVNLGPPPALPELA